jgi:DNA-binding CsgD family transcriptional regulator
METGASLSTRDDWEKLQPAWVRCPLTVREREIVREVACGYNNEEIGALFHISTHTVHTHMYRARLKLRAPNRARLIALVFRYGILRWDGDRLLICADDL